ncbi:MAG: SMP-30/gluconolactonase/LRE family protein [Polyangiales bacterium]
MRSRFTLAAVILPLAACSSTPSTSGTDASVGTDVVTAADVVTADSATPADVPATPADVPATPTDMPTMASCGTGQPTITGIRGTEGLVIGPDGTIYYSQSGAVGRLPPGGSPTNRWAVLTGATTVWGLALDTRRNRLYVGSPATQSLFVVDITADPPTAETFLSGAGQPNGLTIDADGNVFYSDFSGGHVYRVTPDGMRSQVTTTRVSGANGVAFGPDGSLYVESYQAGTLLKLTLTDNRESARSTVASSLGNPDGLAFDADGRIYVGDNGGRRLIRLDADGSNPMVLGTGISAAANVEFGAGALSCTDIYVASSGALYRYTMGTARGAAVPWHR